MAMTEKVSGVLRQFIMGNGRWDLESLKMKVVEIKGQRLGLAAGAANMHVG